MDFDFKVQFAGIGSTIVSELQQQMSALRFNASGRTSARIRFEHSKTELRIIAPAHLFALESGRGKTKGGSGGAGELRKRIRTWIDDKGITPEPDEYGKTISKDSLAFLIARKIHREGTKLYKLHRGRTPGSGVLTDVINDRLRLEIKIAVALRFKEEVVAEMSGNFKKLRSIK